MNVILSKELYNTDGYYLFIWPFFPKSLLCLVTPWLNKFMSPLNSVINFVSLSILSLDCSTTMESLMGVHRHRWHIYSLFTWMPWQQLKLNIPKMEITFLYPNYLLLLISIFWFMITLFFPHSDLKLQNKFLTSRSLFLLNI